MHRESKQPYQVVLHERSAAMSRTVFKIQDQEWCAAEITVRPGMHGECLSITGKYGVVVTRKEAKAQALAYWVSYFEECPEELKKFKKEWDRGTPVSAAELVIATASDEFHGLDVYGCTGDRVLLVQSCGQIREEISRFFPDIAPYFRWHLNDMHAECEHQEARGETDLGAVCPDCAYRLGSAWTHRTLPAEVLAWVKGET